MRYQVVENGIFQGTITGLVVLNVLLMMCERYPMEPGLAVTLEAANLVIVSIFALEMVLTIVQAQAAIASPPAVILLTTAMLALRRPEHVGHPVHRGPLE